MLYNNEHCINDTVNRNPSSLMIAVRCDLCTYNVTMKVTYHTFYLMWRFDNILL